MRGSAHTTSNMPGRAPPGSMRESHTPWVVEFSVRNSRGATATAALTVP